MGRPGEQRVPFGRIAAAGAVIVLALVTLVVVLRPVLFPSAAPSADPSPVSVVPGPPEVDAAGPPGSGQGGVRVLPRDGSRYFGVSVPDADPGPDPSATFTRAVGSAPTLQMFFQSFGDGFDSTLARRITEAGRLPMVTWEPYDWQDPEADPYPLAAIAAGRFDSYLREQAVRFAAVTGPLVIRFAHEMNGDWYPWGVLTPGNTAADYIAAYRHVHDVVTAAGATNVVWMWAPNLIDAAPSVQLATVYPGEDVVDWVGLSGYFTKDDDTFASRFLPTLTQLDAVAPTTPILLAETAVPDTTHRSRQIAELVEGVRTSPRFVGLVWFNFTKRADWTVDDDPAQAAALGAAVAAGGFGAVPEPATGG